MAWLAYIEQSKLAVIYFSNSIAVRSIRLDVAEGIRECSIRRESVAAKYVTVSVKRNEEKTG